MSLSIFKKDRGRRRQTKAQLSLLKGRSATLEALEDRRLLATFITVETNPDIPGFGVIPGEVLVIRGDSSPDTIVVSCDVNERIIVGSVPLGNVDVEDEDGNIVDVEFNDDVDAIVILGNGGADRISTENYGSLQLVDTDGDGVVDDTELTCEQDIFIFGGVGNDQIVGGPNGEYIDGGSSNDLICAGYGDDTIHGDSPPSDFDPGDPLATTFPDQIVSNASGGSGADIVDAGPDDDLVYGWDGADYLNGADGDDALFGGRGNDRLCGAEGFDFLVGGLGSDLLNGGFDDDIMYGDTGDTAVDMVLGGTDYAVSGGGFDTFIDFSVVAVNYYNPGFPDPLDPFTIGFVNAIGSKNFQRRIFIDCPEIVCPVIVVDYSENNGGGSPGGGTRL